MRLKHILGAKSDHDHNWPMFFEFHKTGDQDSNIHNFDAKRNKTCP